MQVPIRARKSWEWKKQALSWGLSDPAPMTAPVPFWMDYCSSSYWTRSSHKGWVTLLFLPALKSFFFFTCGPILLTQLPHSKKHSHLSHSSTYVKGFFFFFKILFLFCHHCHSYHRLKEHGHCLLPPLMFKEEQGVVTTWRSKQHKLQHLQEDMNTRYVFYKKILHLRFL